MRRIGWSLAKVYFLIHWMSALYLYFGGLDPLGEPIYTHRRHRVAHLPDGYFCFARRVRSAVAHCPSMVANRDVIGLLLWLAVLGVSFHQTHAAFIASLVEGTSHACIYSLFKSLA